MFKILKTRFKQGCRTMLFPKAPAPALPSRYRGRPIVAGQDESVDMGKISFDPESGITYSNDYRMAASRREDLVLSKDRQMVLAGALNDKMLKIFGR